MVQQGQDLPKARPGPAADLAEVLGSWELHLHAERKSPQAVKAYGDGVRAYLGWCARAGRPPAIDRRELREFVDALLTDGARPATAASRHLAVRRFSAWLTEEGEQGVDPTPDPAMVRRRFVEQELGLDDFGPESSCARGCN